MFDGKGEIAEDIHGRAWYPDGFAGGRSRKGARDMGDRRVDGQNEPSVRFAHGESGATGMKAAAFDEAFERSRDGWACFQQTWPWLPHRGRRTAPTGGRVSSAEPAAARLAAGYATARSAPTARLTRTPAMSDRQARLFAGVRVSRATRAGPACGTAYSPAAARPQSGRQRLPAGESAVRMRQRPAWPRGMRPLTPPQPHG